MRSLSDIPSSVYRIQLTEEFPLKKAIALVPYLDRLGVEGVYCSPIFNAASSNGYDVINPNELNPLLGTIEEYDAFCQALQERKMQQILDVVPNHMGIKKNHWWLDVLEKGPSSEYADFFDIDWHPLKRELKDKVLLPLLGDVYGKCLESGEIYLEESEERSWVAYGDYRLPLASQTEKKKHSLHELLEAQYYRLAHWKVGGQEINYRRFFNINELVAIHIEKEKVLKAHHAWVFQLLESKKIQGIRVDHPDGLYKPHDYFLRLREKGAPLIIVEKILDFKEQLPDSWEVDGSVGYDYLAISNGIFIKKENEKYFTQLYEKFIDRTYDFEGLLYEKKKRIVRFFMGSEWQNLGWRLDRLSEKNIYFRDFSRVDLTEALQEIIACFPVYRTYLAPNQKISKKERNYILEAVEKAKQRRPEIDISIYNYLRDLLLLESPHMKEEGSEAFDFLLRFQQLTPSVTAKALEDAVYYIYNRFISLNEVGSDPSLFGISKAEFDHFNEEKLTKWPLGFLATSTHDSKFSEDVRMRLNVLSEIPQKWEGIVSQWQENNHKYKQEIAGVYYPDANTEYYLYQMLIGVWPEEVDRPSQTLLDRLWKVVFKIVREAGIYTSWSMPKAEYENALQGFFQAIFNTPSFLLSFLSFQREIARYGKWNSLSSLTLKLGSCGIFDLFQGNESWNFFLVDPDNRHPVDFEAQAHRLNQKEETKQFLTSRGLHFRRENKELFLEGEYVPLKVMGKHKEHVIAFMRKVQNKSAVVVASRFFTSLTPPESAPVGSCWEGTSIVLPKEVSLTDIFTLQTLKLKKEDDSFQLPLEGVFSTYPCAILEVRHVGA